MRWTDRQQAMLQEMGLRLWLPGALAADAAAVAAAAVAAPASPSAHAPEALPAILSVALPAAVPEVRPASQASAAAAPATARPPHHAAQGAPGHRLGVTPDQPSSAASQAVAAMDWPALRQAVAGCQACGLCASRQQTVFGVGSVRARLMVVGEAPGEQEDQRGEPFVGAAVQMLDRMLAALGLGREPTLAERQVFIANALKCRPPRNRNAAVDDLAACRPYLERQVALVQPRVILAMGAVAVQSLLGSDAPIGRLRGQVHRWQGVPLVVTYDPAYLVRQGAHKARAWDDLCLAAQVLAASPGR